MVNLRKRQAKASDDAPSQYVEQRYVVVRFRTAVTERYLVLMTPASCSSHESKSDTEDEAPDQVASQKHVDKKVDHVTQCRLYCEASFIHSSGRAFAAGIRGTYA